MASIGSPPAIRTAGNILRESPLAEIPRNTPPGRANGSAWVANTGSNPWSLPVEVTAEVLAGGAGIFRRLILRPRLRDAWTILSAALSIPRRDSRSENMPCTTGALASLFSCTTLRAVTVVGIPSSPGSQHTQRGAKPGLVPGVQVRGVYGFRASVVSRFEPGSQLRPRSRNNLIRGFRDRAHTSRFVLGAPPEDHNRPRPSGEICTSWANE
jgi:hypothetical protein